MQRSKGNRPEKQHYVTKGYLNGFTIKDLCVVKDLRANQIRTNQNPAKICKISNYYTLDIPQDPYGLEKELGREIENKIIPILVDIGSSRRMPNDQYNKDLLLNWLAWIYLSNPTMRDWFDEILNQIMGATLDQICDEILLDHFKQKGLEMPIEKIRKVFDEYELKYTNEQFLKKITPLIYLILRSFSFIKWSIFSPQDNLEFVCSDNPLVRIGNLADENCEYFFPVNKHTLLYGTYKDSSIRVIRFDKNSMRKINMLSYKNAYRYVIASSIESLYELEDDVGNTSES